MGKHCCGGHAPKSNLGSHTNVITAELSARMERNNLRWDKIKATLAKFKDDGMWFYEELDLMNKAGNRIIANNHELRAEIYDLTNELRVAKAQIEKFKEASSIEELEKAKAFPFDQQFRPIQ